MNGLHFHQLLLLSNSKRLANQFNFPKRLNLVTGNDNSIGKSSLAKCLLWALGCEPSTDEEWKSNDVMTLLYFSVNNEKYAARRYGNNIAFGKVNDAIKTFSKITGEYAREFANAVNFDLVLKNREDELECPPPAYFYLPFYIDQKKSWDTPWDSLDNLYQFNGFRSNLIKYFSGYIGSEFLELEKDIFEEKAIEKSATTKIERLDIANESFAEIEDTHEKSLLPLGLNGEELTNIQNEIKSELKEFVQQQCLFFDEQTRLLTQVHELKEQLKIVESSTKELEDDYKFSVESIPEEVLECPLCGTHHDNSITARAGLLADKAALEDEENLIKDELRETEVLLETTNQKLRLINSEVDRIKRKYDIHEQDEESQKQSLSRVILSLSSRNIAETLSNKKAVQQQVIQNANEKQKGIKKVQRKLLTKKDKEELDSFFMGNLLENIKSLDATGINLNKVKTPMDYKKLLGGGAAEGTRGVLAYQLAILRQIQHAKNCEMATFIVDTPNQQEQASHRYGDIVKALLENVPKNQQIILCCMENDALKPMAEQAHIITLDSRRLLKPDEYTSIKKLFDEFEVNVIPVSNP